MKNQAEIEASIRTGEPISQAYAIIPAELPSHLHLPTTGFPTIETASFRLLRNNFKNNIYAQSVHAFEILSLRIRDAANKTEHDPGILNRISAQNIQKAICQVASPNATPDNKHSAQAALHLEGYLIEGDLDLSRIDIRFPIRIIGCIIEGALLLNKAKLVSLDLSGSFIRRGIEASYLIAEQNVRLRRTVSCSCVDFGGMEIGGTFDAVDAICIPVNQPLPGTSWTARKSIFNLARAKIGGDLRLMRGRIYGGINLRTATVNGSLFMNDLLVRSPHSTIEKLMLEQLPASLYAKLDPHQISSAIAEDDLVTLLRREDTAHLPNPPLTLNHEAERLESISLPGCPSTTADFCEGLFRQTLMSRLLIGNEATRQSAVRAEQLSVCGMVMGRGMIIGGNCKFKRLSVSSELSLAGSRFRSAESIKNGLEKIANLAECHSLHKLTAFFDHIKQALNVDQDTGRTQRHQYALDLRSVQIGDSVDLGKDSRSIARRKADYSLVFAVAERLCATGEDPVKFLQLFHQLPGNLHDFAADIQHQTSPYHKIVRKAVQECQSIGRELDPESYRFRDEIREDERARNVIAYAESLGYSYPANLPYLDQLQLSIGRMPAHLRYTDDQVERVQVACASLEGLKSTLLIGQVNIADAKIGGSLKLLGFIANVFTDDQDESTMITLNNATIGGDCDFRDSAGITSVDATQLRVTGSVRFANSPKYDATSDLFGPLRRRALLTSYAPTNAHTIAAQRPYRRFDFERASIGGNFTIVFDRDTGPTLDLAYAQVHGKLAIVPAIAGVEINSDEIHADQTAAAVRRNVGSTGPYKQMKFLLARLVEKNASINPIKSENTSALAKFAHGFVGRWANVERNPTRAKWIAQTHRPYIDLRSLTTEVFAHPPSAWPQQDGLLVEGLKYERSQEFGPLLAPRRRWGQIETQRRQNTINAICGALIACVAAFVLLFARRFYIFENGENVAYWLGKYNTLVAAWLITILIFLVSLRWFTSPKTRHREPLALSYFALQRRRLDEGKLRHAVQPHQPYIHAAKVLRSAGRTDAADRVELERLRLRRKLLSFRIGLPLRTMLKLTDIVSLYGFRPMRVVYISLVILLVSAMTLQYGYKKKLVLYEYSRVHTPPKQAQQNPSNKAYERLKKLFVGNKALPSSVVEALEDRLDELAEGARNSISPEPAVDLHNRTYPKFISFLYAADVMIPFLDLDQEDHTIVVGHAISTSDTRGKDNTVEVWYIPYFLRIFGWFATGIVTIAVAARLETIMARNEDN